MNWSDEGFLLSKNKFSENSIIIEAFTLNHGKCSGIVYGGTSRRIKNYLQLGNKLHFNLKRKNENKLGYFTIEIIDAISPFFFDDDKKIFCLFATLNILKNVLPEYHSYNKIYFLLSNFLEELKTNNNWISLYIFWEVQLLKEIGFDLNLADKKNISSHNKKDIISVNIDNEKISIPDFLIKNKTSNIDPQHIYLALKFIGDFIEKNIFLPNNLKYPFARKKLESLFK